MSIFNTEVLAASKESHRGELDHREGTQENTRLSSPPLPPPPSSCWFDDLLPVEINENMMVTFDSFGRAGEEVSRAQVFDASGMTESRNNIEVKAACHKFVKLNTERAPTGPAAPDANVSSEAGLSPRVTKKGAPAPSASKSHGSTRWFNNHSRSVKVTSSGSGGARVQKKTIDLASQLHGEWTDAVNSCQHQHSSQGGVSDQLDSVWKNTYPGSLQNGWDTTHPKGSCTASAATAATTTARKNVAAAARARAASFAPASRIVSKLRRIERFPSLDVLHAGDISSHQRGNVLEFDAFSSPPRRMVVLDKDIERAAVSTLRGDADAEETKKNADVAVENNVANVFPDGATSISAALDEIDQRYLLPAMARIEQRREETFKSQGDVARCYSTSMPLGGEEVAMKKSLSENNDTSKISGVACRPHDGGGFHDKKHVTSHAVTRPTGLLGTPFQSKLRATISASPAQDHSLIVDSSTRSSTSTWLPPVIIEHNVHANNQAENMDEAVHKSYLDHARKLGSLLANAVIDNRLVEAHESYMKTVPLWRMDDDVLVERNISIAVDTAAVDPGPTTGPAHTTPENIEDIFSGEQFDGEVDIFSGKEGHELFVRLLMEGDESMGLDFTA